MIIDHINLNQMVIESKYIIPLIPMPKTTISMVPNAVNDLDFISAILLRPFGLSLITVSSVEFCMVAMVI